MVDQSFLDGKVLLRPGDCLDVLRAMPDNSIDSCCTDPPYGLAFMGKGWDTSGPDQRAFAVEFWAEVYRVLKPGAWVVAASGTRTYHRLAVAIEDAGFEIRDQILWVFGSGFPKSHNVHKVTGLDEHIGLGTSLKPATEPWCLARKPLESTVAGNVLKWGTGALNIAGCRIDATDKTPFPVGAESADGSIKTGLHSKPRGGDDNPTGRWPANVVTDGSDEVVGAFPDRDGAVGMTQHGSGTNAVYGEFARSDLSTGGNGVKDFGSAARFFASFPQASAPIFEEVTVSWMTADKPRSVVLQVDAAQSPPRVIAASASEDANEWNTFLFGSGLTDLFRSAASCTTSMATNSTTGLRTWNWLTLLRTSVCTADACSAKMDGGSRAAHAAGSNPSLNIISGQTVSLPGASLVTSSTPLKISVSAANGSNRRFHYSAKADADDRIGSAHPTIKPVDLMQWLVRLVTPKGGLVLDPFAGTGTTGEAAFREGMRAVLVEREPEYQSDIARRMAHVLSGPDARRHTILKAKGKVDDDAGPLFGGLL